MRIYEMRLNRQDAKTPRKREKKEWGLRMPFDDEIPPFDYAEPPADLDRLAHAVIGAAIEVHRELGAGHLEEAYEKALAAEMKLRGIPFAQQVKMPLFYKGEQISESRIDFVVGGILVVEIKSCDSLAPIQTASS